MISETGLSMPTFAKAKSGCTSAIRASSDVFGLHRLCTVKCQRNDMPNVESQKSAMEYAMWYQEHLLQMEDMFGKKMEAKIEEILDRKLQEYINKVGNENHSNIH